MWTCFDLVALRARFLTHSRVWFVLRSLWGNDIGDAGAVVLGKGLETNSALQKLE